MSEIKTYKTRRSNIAYYLEVKNPSVVFLAGGIEALRFDIAFVTDSGLVLESAGWRFMHNRIAPPATKVGGKYFSSIKPNPKTLTNIRKGIEVWREDFPQFAWDEVTEF